LFHFLNIVHQPYAKHTFTQYSVAYLEDALRARKDYILEKKKQKEDL